MTADVILRIISIVLLALGLYAFIRAARLRDRAEARHREAERLYRDAEYMGTIIPESYHWVNDHDGGIRVIAGHGVENAVVKRIPYREGDIEDYRFAVREAEELIEILKRKTI